MESPVDITKPRYIDISEQLHSEMKAAAARKRITVSAAYALAAEQWLSPAVPVSTTEANPKEQQYIQSLLEMIRSDDDELLPVVTHNLNLWKKKTARRKEKRA